MTALIVIALFVGFVVLDVIVRAVSRRMETACLLREREAVLSTAVRLEVAPEVKSLKRVEVPGARARVLAVDDEPVVLDSLRRILVLEGYSVDTIETGPEALALVQRHDYDFVFTDLKMPGMDGVEVVKAVRHLRPDVDIAVITGYATIESAVETLQQGAVAYVQKPFTADEMSKFVGALLIKRQARLEAHRRPAVRVVAPAMAEVASQREFCVPGGAFVSAGHAWARLEPDGQVRVGLDDFARKALGSIEALDLPEAGAAVRRGEPLFTVRRAGHAARVTAPVGGRVMIVNAALRGEPGRVNQSPYDRGWVCLLQPAALQDDLGSLRIGRPVVEWYREEIERLAREGGPAENGAPAVGWEIIEEKFLRPTALVRA